MAARMMLMLSVFAAPLLLAVMIGLILVALVWGLVRVRGRHGGDAALEPQDELIAALVLAVSLAYFVTGLGP
jgi:hypothetical protein